MSVCLVVLFALVSARLGTFSVVLVSEVVVLSGDVWVEVWFMVLVSLLIVSHLSLMKCCSNIEYNCMK